MISLWSDWFDLLAVQGTLKSLFQHHSLKASILQHSSFFAVQLSYPYMTTGKTVAWTMWIYNLYMDYMDHHFVSKVMSLIFNMLYKFVISFLPRSRCVLISWLQSLFSEILEPKEKIYRFPLLPCLFAMKWWGQMPWSLSFWMLSFKPASSKDYCWWKKSRYLKECRVFSCMGRCKIWACLNHPFYLQLSYPGPVSFTFPSRVSSGCTIAEDCSDWWLDGCNILFFFFFFFWQVTFFFF